MAPIAKPETKTKPVRVDLVPAVHKALRRAAADEDKSMAALPARSSANILDSQTKGVGSES